jgi:hypothetical protein
MPGRKLAPLTTPPESMVGGIESASATPEASFEPYMDDSEPGVCAYAAAPVASNKIIGLGRKVFTE